MKKLGGRARVAAPVRNEPEAFERYARENFGMHKEGETITIIEYETSRMSKSTHRTYPDGTPVQPLYTEGLPQQPGFQEPWWTMVQEQLDREFQANDWALERLKQGAVDCCSTHRKHYLPRILRDIQLPYLNLGLVVEGSTCRMEAVAPRTGKFFLDKLQGYITSSPTKLPLEPVIGMRRKCTN